MGDTILVYDYPRTAEDVEDWHRFGKIDSYFVMLDTLDQTVLDKIQLEYDEECERIKIENRRLKLEQRQREREEAKEREKKKGGKGKDKGKGKGKGKDKGKGKKGKDK